LEVKQATADTTKLNKESGEEVAKGAAEIEVKKETKAKKAAAEKPQPADLEKPWGTPAEVWTANMPDHHLEGYSKKAVKEQQLAQAKTEEQGEESESENESEDEDSGDESDE